MLILVFIFFLVILVWEILALLTKEKYFPTWSRMIWALVRIYPKSIYVIVAIIIVLGVWVGIHLSGECALGIC